MEYLLAVDAGTTSVKAGLFCTDGRCLGIARQEYQLDTPAVDRAELDPEIYWQGCLATIRQVMEGGRVNASQVTALGVSSQGETLICVDADGRPLYPAIIWLDNRATRQADDLASQFSELAYQMTGIPEVIATWPACKIKWLKDNEPEVFNRVDKFLLVQDFLIQRLTGLFVTNASIACTSLYFDFINNDWWQPVLDAIGISVAQLPRLSQPGAVVGMLLPTVAQQLGLPVALKVVACGMDQCTGAIGAGNIFPGCCSETTGAALTIQVSVPQPDIDKKKIIPVYAHSIPGQYLLVPVCPTAGMAYKWFRDVFCLPEIEQAARNGLDSYELITRLAAPVAAGSEGLLLLPHLMGAYSPTPNTAARGSFTGFTLTHTRGHFARAVLEGVAFLLKLNLDVILATGLEIREIRSTGGGSRSALWNQIKANVCNLPVVSLINEDTALVGDAVLTGVACGGFETIAQGCQVMLDLKDRFIPDTDAQTYAESYRRYCDLDLTLADYYKRNF